MKKKSPILLLAFFLNFIGISAQTVVSYSTAANALTTYKFTYVTTGAVGSGTSAPNIFILAAPTGYPNFVAYSTIPSFAPNATLKVNGTPVAIDTTNFSQYGSWSSGIQLSANFTIPAGATIELTVSNIISNPNNTSGTYTFNWKTAAGSGAAIQSYSVPVTFSNLSTTELVNKQSLLISANPAKDFTSINNISIGEEVSLYDITGKLIFKTKANDKSITLNTSSYKDGVYIIKAGDKTSKLIVSK